MYNMMFICILNGKQAEAEEEVKELETIIMYEWISLL